VEVIFRKVNGATIFGNEGMGMPNLAAWFVKLEARAAG
jgi:hypothetical protein